MSDLPPPPPQVRPIGEPLENFESHRSFPVTFLLALFFGIVGADRFYLGKQWTGALKLLSGGGLWLWWLADLVLLLKGQVLDSKGRPLSKYPQSMVPFAVGLGAALVLILGLLVFAVVFGERVA